MKSSKLPGMLSVKSKKGLDYMDMILKTTDLCKRAGEALKLAVISPERRRLQSLLAPETGTDAQRVYLFRGCAGDSRKAA